MNRQPSSNPKAIPSKGDLAARPAPGAGRSELGDRKGKHAGGRPPKFSPGQWAEVARQIGRGMPVKYACILNGVSHDAYEKKLQRDAEFVRAVEEAKAKFLDLALTVIQTDTPGHIGMKWTLDRRHAADFHKADVEVNVKTDIHNGIVITPELQAQLQESARRLYLKHGGRN